MNRLHAFAHVNELGYQAVRRALFPAGLPMHRDTEGRFTSRCAVTAERLRGELAATNNLSLAEAIELSRRTSEPRAVEGVGG